MTAKKMPALGEAGRKLIMRERVWFDATRAVGIFGAPSNITCADIVPAARTDHATNTRLRDFLNLLLRVAHLQRFSPKHPTQPPYPFSV